MKMRSTLTLILAAALLTLLTGCPVAEVPLDEVWGTTHQNLEAADGDVADEAEQGAVDPDAVDLDSDCPDGGTVTLAGTLEQSVTPGEVAQSFDYTATFVGCTEDDLVIDGEIDYLFEQEVNALGVVQTWDYSGTLTYTGAYNGSCEVDVQGEQAATDTSASITWTGSFCGEDASVALYASSE